MTKRLALALLWLAVPGAQAQETGAVRTLDATNIEGEIRLPQVLFITSRESDRPLDFLDWYAPMTGLEVGREAPLPNRIHVIRLDQLEVDEPAAETEESEEPTASTPKEDSP